MIVSEKRLAANRRNAEIALAKRIPIAMVDCVCKECGVKFQIWPSRAKRRQGDVCSWECRVKYRRGINAIAGGPRADMVGKNNPNWNGGTSTNQPQRNTTGEHLAWKRKIFYRDNYTCQKCGETKDIQAHHIFHYADHADLREAVENGVTLCKQCHKENHSDFRISFKFWKPIMEDIANGNDSNVFERIKSM